MWPFAFRSPLPTPQPPRISSADPGFALAWHTYDFRRALFDASDARAWARWYRQWAVCFAATWAAWTAFMLWPSSDRLHPVSPLLLGASLTAGTLWFAWDVRDCIVKARAADKAEAEADEDAEEIEHRINEAARELMQSMESTNDEAGDAGDGTTDPGPPDDDTATANPSTP